MFALNRFDPTQHHPPQQPQTTFYPLERLNRRLEEAKEKDKDKKKKEKEKEKDTEAENQEIQTEEPEPNQNTLESHQSRRLEALDETPHEEIQRPLTKKQKARIELGFTGPNSIPLPAQDGTTDKKQKTPAKIKYLKKKKARTKSRKQLLRQSVKKDDPTAPDEQQHSQSISVQEPVHDHAPSLDPSSQNPSTGTTETQKKRVKRPKNLDSALEKITKKKIKTKHEEEPKKENTSEGQETKQESNTKEEEEEGENSKEEKKEEENSMIIAQPGVLPRFPGPINSSRPDPRVLARLAMGLGYPTSSSTNLPQDFIHFESQTIVNLDQIHIRPSNSTPSSSSDTLAPFSLSLHSVNRLNQLGFKSILAVQIAVLSILMPSLSMQEKTPGTIFYPTRNPPRDLCVNAPTGSGKTLSYIIPIIETLKSRLVCRIRALIVLPTRDLVLQVKNTFDTFSSGTGLKAAILTGHHSFSREQELIGGGSREGSEGLVDVVIATPGRLLDHLTYTPGFSTHHLCFLVLDEADQLLNKNSQNWLHQILNPTKTNTEKNLNHQHHKLNAFKPFNKSFLHLFDEKYQHHQQQQAHEDEFLNQAEDDLVPNLIDNDDESKLSKPSQSDISASRPLWTLPVDTFNPCKLRPFRILLFSATLKRDPTQVDHLGLRNPIFIKVSSTSTGLDMEQDQTGTTTHDDTQKTVDTVDESLDHLNGFSLPSTLKQHIIVTRTDIKPLVFIKLILSKRIKKALCFCKSIEGAERLTSLCKLIFQDQDSINTIQSSEEKLQKDHVGVGSDTFQVEDLFKVECFSSDLSPVERSKLLKSFQLGHINMLICSDMIARGMDISGIENVINYDAPIDMKKYVHRVGRTARANQTGFAFTLIESQEAKFFKNFLKIGLGGRLDNVIKLRFGWFDIFNLNPPYQLGLKKLAEKYARSIDL